MVQQLGMIAGAGELPEIIARQTFQDGHALPTVALSAEVATRLAPYCPTLAQYGPGQLTQIIRALRQHAVRQVVIIGKVHKQQLFATARLDLRMLRMISRAPNYRDSTLFRALVAELARDGLEVVEQTRLLGRLLTPVGVLGDRQPSRGEWQDIHFGFRQAKRLAAYDIGQTVVVRRQTVLAVEAVEGTDVAVQRGCELGRRGAVVVKVCRPQQDLRFDVPTVGPQTLQVVAAGRASVLAVEAGTTLMIRLSELVATANAQRIALVGMSQTLLQSFSMGERG
ncbi:UDP-2,3-diacylglucosamine pyrophosphatase LpxI [Candidatus Entotheonellaceae bacterium PAL068K]